MQVSPGPCDSPAVMRRRLMRPGTLRTGSGLVPSLRTQASVYSALTARRYKTAVPLGAPREARFFERKAFVTDEQQPHLRPAGDPEDARQALEAALFEVKRVIVGQDAMLERVFVALLAGGHLLLEGVPGLAKTLTIKTVAEVLGGTFKRIQFTPDLVPADLVGTRIYRPDTRRVRHRARAGVLQLPPRRRDQPRAREGAVGAARGHAGAPGHDRPADLRGPGAVPRAWRPRTRSSPRAPTRCPRPRSTGS